ncbi:protein DMP8-like [Cornus florida]|uniref:protein DMP8-like n=1 Tax=Cornus florida TaxID=4283 RepID=UPI00289E3689|nr:protein DMP8-like [Cornus florida]
MEQTEDIGIKVYNTPLHDIDEDGPDTTIPSPDHLQSAPGEGRGRKKRAMAKGVQKTLSKTSMLANFLPTGTLLTFEMVIPSVYHNGSCTHVSTMMITFLLVLCCLSCFFFHFTDSFRGPDGKVYYGFVTPNGLAVFKPGLGVHVPKEERFMLSFRDFVHAIMSVMVFTAIAFSDHRVTNCVFPGHEKEMDEVMESFPLMVGIVCSSLFLVFPNTRYGIGCMAT